MVDNGIGLEESQRKKTHGTGRGLEVIQRIVSLYESLRGIQIKLSMHSNEEGTTVVIVLPLQNSSSKKQPKA